MVIRTQYCNNIIHIFKELNLPYTVDRETIDVPSFISYTSQSISALSWVVAMHTTMSHISCLISALWPSDKLIMFVITENCCKSSFYS